MLKSRSKNSDLSENVNEQNENIIKCPDIALYILNEKNKYISREFINDLLKKYDINIEIKNLEIYQCAMTHESYLLKNVINDKNDKLIKMIKDRELEPISQESNAIPLQNQSYETLEYLGDSIIHSILAEYLYDRYPTENEGFLTKLRTKIENGPTLSKLARELGLHEYVLLARNVENVGGRDKNFHIFEDTFESFLGALYIDSDRDYRLCKKFVINVIEKHIDIADLIYNETNHKDTLLQYYHKMRYVDPVYELVEQIEKNSKKYFRMCVRGPDGSIVGTGIAPSKKKGEQNAAANALKYFNIIKEDDVDEDIYAIYDSKDYNDKIQNPNN
mgnify:CR=1 FL=1